MSMGITHYWRGLTFSSSGNLPDTGIQHIFPIMAGKFFATEQERQPITTIISVLEIEALKNNNIFQNNLQFWPFPAVAAYLCFKESQQKRMLEDLFSQELKNMSWLSKESLSGHMCWKPVSLHGLQTLSQHGIYVSI